MIDVSQEFKDAWANKTWKQYGWRVRVKRRFFNGSIFTNETEFIELRSDEVKDVQQMPQQIDSEFEGVFLISEFVITVQNERLEWIESLVPPSFFAADDDNANGYIARGSIIDVSSFLKLQDNSIEYAVMFTGVLKEAPKLLSGTTTVDLTVISLADIIVRSDAEDISDEIFLEDCIPPTGNGTTKLFTTTSKAIAAVDDLQKAAVTINQGRSKDYSIDDINQDKVAEFDLTSAPPSPETLKWSGRKWKEDLNLETFVGLILDNANFGPKREIENILFPGGLSGSKQVNTQAEWQNGTTINNMDSTTVVDSTRRRWHRIDDFADGDLTSNPVWSVNPGGSITVVSNKMESNVAGFASVPASLINTKTFGSISFELARTSGNVTVTIAIKGGFGPGGGFSFSLVARYDGSTLKLITIDSVTGETVLGSIVASGTIVCKAHYDAATGDCALAFTGATSGIITTTATLMHFAESLNFSGVGTFDNFFFSDEILQITNGPFVLGDMPDGSTPVFVSEEFDVLANPTSWGKLDTEDIEVAGFTILYETAVADISGGPFDAFIAIDGAGNILSALKRFLLIRVTITQTGNNSVIVPRVDKVVANFATTNIAISVLNLAGIDGWDGLLRYVPASDAIMGLRGDGTFFLKNRSSSSSPVADLTQENCLIELLEFDPGDRRVVTVGRVRYDGYVSTFDGDDFGETSPTPEERHGRIPKTENLTNVIYSNDVDLGAARARNLYENRRLRLRRWRFRCWIVPWLELIDRVTITFVRDPIAIGGVFGDKLLDGPGGPARIAFGDKPLVFANNVTTRILAWTPDVVRINQCELFVEEILNA